jgi:hypothetical protein
MAGATFGIGAVPQKMRDVRVPFVRRCRVEFEDGRTGTAFLVNINVQGAYVARDDLRPAGAGASAELPALGATLRCFFHLPGRARDLAVSAVVTWVNPRQEHPVHGLPPGFGLSFRGLSDGDRDAIAQVVDDYLARHPAAR